MQLKFKGSYVNEEMQFSVGIVLPMGEYAMRVVDPTHVIMTDVEIWDPEKGDPSALFGITEEEYALKDTDPEKLADLAQRLRSEIPTDRLLAEQNGVRRRERAASVDYGKYERYLKAKREKQRDDVIADLLSNENLYAMYCAETGRPYIFGYRFIMMFKDKSMAMEAANEYRKKNVPLIVHSFAKETFNKEDAMSIFREFSLMGMQYIMYVGESGMQSLLFCRDILNHAAFLGNKTNAVYGNAMLDFALTHYYQYLRTPNLNDRTDPEKFKKAVAAQLAFNESRVTEGIAEARFLVPTMTDAKGNLKTPIVRMTKEAKGGEDEGETKSFLPVFTSGMEFVSENGKFKASVLPYDSLLQMVKDGKLDGFIINMKSQCSLVCTESRYKQVEEYLKWKKEHPAETRSEVPEELKTANVEADTVTEE